MRRSDVRLLRHGATLLAVLAALACASAVTPGPIADEAPAVRWAADAATVASDIEVVRSATRTYHDLDSAVAAGYPRSVRDCLVHEHHGAMGYHHVNSAYMDGKLDLTRPEILLYEHDESGRYRLNGVEFILPFRFWPRDSTPPTLFGRQLQREDNLNFWYMHVWAWKENPDGVFADFHPLVTCPDSSSRVYKPSSGS